MNSLKEYDGISKTFDEAAHQSQTPFETIFGVGRGRDRGHTTTLTIKESFCFCFLLSKITMCHWAANE
jgi:hypothetical protein